MKKWMILLLALLLPLTALAEERAVYGTGVKLTFAQPEGTVLLTRESSAEEFAAQGLDQAIELAAMERESRIGGLYWTEMPGTVTYLYVWFDGQDDLNDRSSRALRKDIRQGLMNLGYTVEESAYLKKQGLNALRFTGWKDLGGTAEYVAAYDLWVNGCHVRLRTYGEGKVPGDAFLAELDDLAASVACETGKFGGVGTDEMEDGTFVVTMAGVEFSFMPPEGCVCITQESSASVFNRVSLSQREEVPYMVENGIYAYLLDEQGWFEVHITAYPFVGADYDDVPAVDESALVAAFRNDYRNAGVDVQSASIYQAADGHKFVRTAYSWKDAGVTTHVVEYLTCQHNYAVKIALLPYWGAATEDQLAWTEALADTLRIRVK